MKNYYIFILFFVILLSGCIKNEITTENNNTDEKLKLPENFTLILAYDGTSSGGSRVSKFQISFEGDMIIAADKSYHSSSGGGENFCMELYNTSTREWGEPIWKGKYAEWMKENKIEEPKSCHNIIYLSREEIIQAIQSGKITPKEKGCHYKTCYEIIED